MRDYANKKGPGPSLVDKVTGFNWFPVGPRILRFFFPLLNLNIVNQQTVNSSFVSSEVMSESTAALQLRYLQVNSPF